MSDANPNDGAAPPAGGEPPAELGQGSEPPAGGGEPDYSLASDFLQRVDEADRATVEKYVKQWDAGVTRRFQELHGQYEPYKALGEPEQLQQAIAVMQLLEEQPQAIYQILLEDIQNGAEWAQALQQAGGQQQQQNSEGAPDASQSFQGLPPEVKAQLDEQQRILEQLAQIVVGDKTAQQQAAEDAALEQYMSNLKTEFGEFDENYVLALMEGGMDGAEAVKSFQSLLQQHINQAFSGQQVPVPLSGGGAPPQQQQKVTELGKRDVRDLVAGLMSATTQAQS